MNIIQKLEKKYDLRAGSYLSENVWEKQTTNPIVADKYKELCSKWKHRIAPKWYGFDLTEILPLNFYSAIDDFLEYVSKNDKDFKILQIKLKLGGIRIYLDSISIQTQEYARQLEDLLYDENLIY